MHLVIHFMDWNKRVSLAFTMDYHFGNVPTFDPYFGLILGFRYRAVSKLSTGQYSHKNPEDRFAGPWVSVPP